MRVSFLKLKLENTNSLLCKAPKEGEIFFSIVAAVCPLTSSQPNITIGLHQGRQHKTKIKLTLTNDQQLSKSDSAEQNYIFGADAMA